MSAATSTDRQENINNGLITKIWGSPGWTFNHSVTFGYPINPTAQQKEDYKNYFIHLGSVLPCKYCRDSYQNFIKTGDTALTDNDLKDRNSLAHWFYRIHNAVNDKLGINYAVSFNDVTARYESFRAMCKSTEKMKGCVAPLDYKAFSFRKLNRLDCPVISYVMIGSFVEAARLRGMDPIFFTYIPLAFVLDGDFDILKKQSSWISRNEFCQAQIKFMRENAIKSIETDGPWMGTPSIEELKLILFLCSNLNKNELEDCHNKLLDIIGTSKIEPI